MLTRVCVRLEVAGWVGVGGVVVGGGHRWYYGGWVLTVTISVNPSLGNYI